MQKSAHLFDHISRPTLEVLGAKRMVKTRRADLIERDRQLELLQLERSLAIACKFFPCDGTDPRVKLVVHDHHGVTWRRLEVCGRQLEAVTKTFEHFRFQRLPGSDGCDVCFRPSS